MLFLLHSKWPTCYFLNIPANSISMCLFLLTTWTTLVFFQGPVPYHLLSEHFLIFQGKGHSLSVSQLEFVHISKYFVTHYNVLFAFLFFLLLNLPPWQPREHLARDVRATLLVIFEFPKSGTVLGI